MGLLHRTKKKTHVIHLATCFRAAKQLVVSCCGFSGELDQIRGSRICQKIDESVDNSPFKASSPSLRLFHPLMLANNSLEVDVNRKRITNCVPIYKEYIKKHIISLLGKQI